jgi:hypothetical protein
MILSAGSSSSKHLVQQQQQQGFNATVNTAFNH